MTKSRAVRNLTTTLCRKLCLTTAALLTLSACSPPETMRVVRQIDEVSPNPNALSPQHKVHVNAIARVSNGDFIVTGGNTSLKIQPWAARFSSDGHLRWEFLDGSPEGWNYTSPTMNQFSYNNEFFDAVELADGATLLCGNKLISRKPTAFLDRLDATGKRIDERLLTPPEDGVPGGSRCLPWGGGIMLLTGLERSTHPTGWLSKLDSAGNILWDKYGDIYSSYDAMVSPSHQLFLLSVDEHGMEILKLDDAGNVVARHDVPEGALSFIHSLSPSSQTIGVCVTTDAGVEILNFDPALRTARHVKTFKDVSAFKAYELSDGSLIIFGEELGRPAPAAVVRVYGNLSATTFPLLPPGAFSVTDAAPAARPNEFVTVRDIRGTSVLAWVSLSRK